MNGLRSKNRNSIPTRSRRTKQVGASPLDKTGEQALRAGYEVMKAFAGYSSFGNFADAPHPEELNEIITGIDEISFIFENPKLVEWFTRYYPEFKEAGKWVETILDNEDKVNQFFIAVNKLVSFFMYQNQPQH